MVNSGYRFQSFSIDGVGVPESNVVGTWYEYVPVKNTVDVVATFSLTPPTPIAPGEEDNPYIESGQYGDFEIVYIKTPNKFVKDLQNPQTGWVSYFDWSTTEVPDAYKFECNETMAEELISLAVMFALENVESQRLGTKLNMRGLEA
mgnify:CR=1 FL=1